MEREVDEVRTQMSTTGLSKLERARLDALYARVRQGDHYDVLGVHPGASEAQAQQEYQQLLQFMQELWRPERDLGEHRVRVEVVLRAIENAWRIVGNPRERLRYNTQQAELLRGVPRPAAVPAPVSEAAALSARSTASRTRTEAMLPAHLIAVLEAQLSTLLRKPVDLRALSGGGIDYRDGARAARTAEEAEAAGRWDDAAVWWHLAGLAAPTDPNVLLRAAAALRRAGVPAAFEHYARVTQRHPVFQCGPDGDGPANSG
jgi:hypothetical protein